MNPSIITPGELAPDFELEDINGNLFGFPVFVEANRLCLLFCAALCDRIAARSWRACEIIMPNSHHAARRLLRLDRMYKLVSKVIGQMRIFPISVCPILIIRSCKLYRQEVNLFKLGRMPLNCVVDINGRIRYVHYGSSMTDIPDNETFLNVIDKLNTSSN